MSYEKLSDAAAAAVVWALIEDVAKERKEEARLWVADSLRDESLKGVDAVANGEVIGSVTRSKDSEKLDVNDVAAFLEFAIAHHPYLVTIDYRAKETFLRKLKEVDGQWVDPDGLIVPGVWMRPSKGSVRVNKDAAAREVVRGLLSSGRVSLDGITQPELEAGA